MLRLVVFGRCVVHWFSVSVTCRARLVEQDVGPWSEPFPGGGIGAVSFWALPFCFGAASCLLFFAVGGASGILCVRGMLGSISGVVLSRSGGIGRAGVFVCSGPAIFLDYSMLELSNTVPRYSISGHSLAGTGHR